MAFTSTVKDELSRVEPVCSHCDQAVLAALIRIEGTLLFNGPGKYRLEIATDTPVVARFVIRALHEMYGLKTDITMRRSVLHKTPNWLIEVPPQKGLNGALVQLGVMNKEGLERGIAPNLIKKDCCARAYLRGIFLGSGFVNDPKSNFHFELIVQTERLANDIIELLKEKGITAKVTKRRNSFQVYMKSGQSICDFLALIGAHKAMLAIEEERVYKSMRNTVNRQVNAEIANQAKASGAAVRQIENIRKILSRRPLNSLPQGLQEFIKLRYSHPEASLKELGELANPPLSKSAINHRVRRLEQIASELPD